MNILSSWIREYLPVLDVSDRQLAEDLTLRGIAVEGVHALADGGHLFEMDITTNRVDAMNHYGIAREAATIYGVPLNPLEQQAHVDAKPGAGVTVRIEATDLCGRFTAQVVRGVTVRQSEGVMAERFAQLRQKPISNAVDVTNYNWLAMGHPTHAFDLDTLEGGIVVRRAREGERIKLLDGSEKTLTADDLVIADEKKALGLAGVMGGWDSRVTEQTKNILVEAAWFNPAAIRASSRRHGLHTDASHRFERGADLGAAALANRLVTRGIVAVCGGHAEGEITDVVISSWEERTTKRPHVQLATREVQRLLGTTLEGGLVPAQVVEQYLGALGCTLRNSAEQGVFKVSLPSWRLDLEREIDLIEEVARVYGYNRFADTLPSFSGGVVALPHATREEKIRRILPSLGWTEAISSTFCAEHDATTFATPDDGAVPMGNPLNAEAGMLRPSLLPGMAGMLLLNTTRDVSAVRLFEYGTIFTGSTDTVFERPSLALGAYGAPVASRTIPAGDALFFEVKGTVEQLLSSFVLPDLRFVQDQLPIWLEPGRGARAVVAGETVAWFGELSQAERERRKLKEQTVVAELMLPKLFQYEVRQPAAKEPSRFQAVERDLSFLFPDTVRWSDVAGAIRELQINEMISLGPLEIFRDTKGKAVPQGEYSLLLRMVFQSSERTLREDELVAWNEDIVSALKRLGGQHRAA